jgi:DHA1 family tetracycline resistance protein-like MFS transporter
MRVTAANGVGDSRAATRHTARESGGNMTAETPVAARRGALIFIFVTVVLDMLAFGIIIPVLPKLVEQFLNGDTARAAQVYGLFGMAWALMQFVFSPLLGALSDRYGRRPLILLS